MTNNNISLAVLQSCVVQIVNSSASLISQYGISKELFEKLTSNVPWSSNDRLQCRGALETLMHGTLDHIGLPRIELPAEYVAAVVVFFVHPVNLMTACNFLEGHYTTSDLSDTSVNDRVHVPPRVLFAMCLQVEHAELNGFREKFTKKTNRAFLTKLIDLS